MDKAKQRFVSTGVGIEIKRIGQVPNWDLILKKTEKENKKRHAQKERSADE